MFVTRETSICSAAPALALSTTAVSPAARRLGMMTPWTPAHSAVRKIAPRLCGSAISSHTTMNGSSPRSAARSRISSMEAYSRIAACAMMPWCAPVALRESSLRRSHSVTTMPFSRALARMRARVRSVSPRATKILSIVRPARIASATALRPSIRSSLS